MHHLCVFLEYIILYKFLTTLIAHSSPEGVIGWKFVSKSGTMFKIHYLPRQVVCVFQTNMLCEGFGGSGTKINARVNILQYILRIWRVSKYDPNLKIVPLLLTNLKTLRKVTFLKKEVMKASPDLFWKTFLLNSKISLAGSPYDIWLKNF